MFPLQPKDELVFGAKLPNYIAQPDEILDNLIADQAFIQSNNIIDFTSGSSSRSTKQKLPLAGGETWLRQRETKRKDVHGQRSVLHRDNERKRRQDMSNLHASLRALLPLEFVKGKRSMCDHMQEAVNYINHIKSNIQELHIRRDKLKKFCDASGNQTGSSNDGNNLPPNLVTVNLVGKGLEILIICSFGSTGSGLSKIFAQLLEREISVVSCVSTKINGRFLHTILAETSTDVKTLDPSELQEILSQVINLPPARKITPEAINNVR